MTLHPGLRLTGESVSHDAHNEKEIGVAGNLRPRLKFDEVTRF
jgi:hypothetical protein